ncbi:hypothetical protein BCR39DRAFT_492824 [Naematelia encephala]|uniref:Zn(2)-C6 fungal-type domain-containing protein n=1 Tax=Naematelia encephala TaxID=71784 RepID=A0A1Y2BBR4_9TREE|nr:hypothetical protein BCR39DRAFT_492824 [Naematelia encephala]
MPRAESERLNSPRRLSVTNLPSSEAGPSNSTKTTVLLETNRRQPPSCDACRTRKLKCSGRPAAIELDNNALAKVPCEHCREWGLDCAYQYQRKRRGRKNQVVQKLAQEQSARRRSSLYAEVTGDEDSESEYDGKGLEAQQDEFGGGFLPRDSNVLGQRTNPSAEHFGVPLNFGSNPLQNGLNSIPENSMTNTNDLLPMVLPPHQSNYSPQQPSLATRPISGNPYHISPANQSTISPQDNVSPSERSMPPGTTIETVLPRDLANHIISLYLEHVYCIIPIVHKPSFLADLAAHEEERRPQLFALIMAMIAMTLIHVPRTFFPSLPRDGVRKLSDHCMRACNAVTRYEIDNPTLDMICIKYLVFVVHNKHGNVGREASTFGEALCLAIALGLHREDMYFGINPIEAERRRRVWFLLYNADKFEAASRSKPVLLRSDEFLGPEATDLPTELDDKNITMHGYLPSSNPVPLIAGFNILTRIVTVHGDILVHERDIRRRPPQEPEALLIALKEVRKLQGRVKAIADKLPRPFQLDVVNGDTLPTPGWEEIMRDQLDMFFQDPMASESAKDGFLVLKANIHVTLAMTRLRLILHREDLLNRSGVPGTPSRNAAELVAADLGETVDWRHSVYQDLFKAVHGIPIQALAANGPSLVTKIRVVAVTLLDALPAQGHGDDQVQGITAYLLDFLSIMTSIESQFAD